VSAADKTPVAWVQFEADGQQHARAIARECPRVLVDGTLVSMHVRFEASPDFPNASCDLALPAQVHSAFIEGRRLPVLDHPAKRIAVIGDTGCRLKFIEVQSCNDPVQWPFPTIAKSVAAERPDLIVHVGDFFYRETACPPLVAGCANSPYGDNWPAWDADWFVPAAPLFAAAPLVLVRGNHEDCDRGGKGWVRYLTPTDNVECVADEGPYTVDAGSVRMVVFDDSAADDKSASPEQVDHYAPQLRRAAALARGESWLLLHRPIYGAVENAGVFTFTNATMQASAGSSLGPFSAIVSGHIHSFEAIVPDGAPPQIVNGMSGDELDSRVKAGIEGKIVLNRRVKSAFVDAQFGYGVYERLGPEDWTITVKSVPGAERNRCALRRFEASCSVVR
jgi:hypothetical protein